MTESEQKTIKSNLNACQVKGPHPRLRDDSNLRRKGKPQGSDLGSLSLPHLLLKIQLTLNLATPHLPPVRFSISLGKSSAQDTGMFIYNQTRWPGPHLRRTFLPKTGALLSPSSPSSSSWLGPLVLKSDLSYQQPSIIRDTVTPEAFKAFLDTLPQKPSPNPINKDIKYYPHF